MIKANVPKTAICAVEKKAFEEDPSVVETGLVYEDGRGEECDV